MLHFPRIRAHRSALRILLGTNALILIAGATIAPIYALFVENIGGDLLDAGLTGSIYALAAGVTTLVSGRITDRIRESELIVVFGYAIMGIGYLLLILVHSIWTLFLVQALIGFAEAIYSPAFDALYSKHLDRGKAGRQWGTWESMNYFTLAAGAAIGGLIVNQFGFNLLFVIMALLTFTAALYIYFLPRTTL